MRAAAMCLGFARRCLVLSWRRALAMSGTDLHCCACATLCPVLGSGTVLRVCDWYAASGTELGYGGSREAEALRARDAERGLPVLLLQGRDENLDEESRAESRAGSRAGSRASD